MAVVDRVAHGNASGFASSQWVKSSVGWINRQGVVADTHAGRRCGNCHTIYLVGHARNSQCVAVCVACVLDQVLGECSIAFQRGCAQCRGNNRCAVDVNRQVVRQRRNVASRIGCGGRHQVVTAILQRDLCAECTGGRIGNRSSDHCTVFNDVDRAAFLGSTCHGLCQLCGVTVVEWAGICQRSRYIRCHRVNRHT